MRLSNPSSNIKTVSDIIGTTTPAAISAAGNTDLALVTGDAVRTFLIDLQAGGGGYTATATLPSTNAVAGAQAIVMVAVAASSNPRLDFRNLTSTGSLLATIVGTGAARSLVFNFVFDGTNWSQPRPNNPASQVRQSRATFDLAASGISRALNSGVSYASGELSASSGGTTGYVVLPYGWARKFVHGSAKIKATKSTGSSVSGVGFDSNTLGAVPTTGTFFGVSYVAGTGICTQVGARSSPTNAAIVADAALTDGAWYTVGFYFDYFLTTGAGVAVNLPLCVTVSDSTGAVLGRSVVTASYSFYTPNNITLFTNYASGGIKDAKIGFNRLVDCDTIISAPSLANRFASADEVTLWLPAKSNGRLVIACHGYGASVTAFGYTTTALRSVWERLSDAGYVVAIPAMGGSLWGNDTAQSYLLSIRERLCANMGLERTVFLWGDSMGGGACLTAIARETFGPNGVAAAYVAEPVCDLAVASAVGSFTASIAAAYPTTAERNASDPMLVGTKSIPVLFVASASDTTVVRASHTTPMIARIPSGFASEIVATGNHSDASHYKSGESHAFFEAVLAN